MAKQVRKREFNLADVKPVIDRKTFHTHSSGFLVLKDGKGKVYPGFMTEFVNDLHADKKGDIVWFHALGYRLENIVSWLYLPTE